MNGKELNGIGYLKQAPRGNLRDALLSQFFMLIRNGFLLPGDQLPPERELAKILGVGRSSLREVIAVLEASGIIEARQGLGMTIAKEPSIDNLLSLAGSALLLHQNALRDLCEVRVVIECEIVRMAAIYITQEQISRLMNIVEKMERITDPLEYIDVDLDFHLIIAEASNNVVWRSIVQMMRILTHEAILKVVYLPNRLEIATTQHKEVVQALMSRDPDQAYQVKYKHLSIFKNEGYLS